MSLPAAPLPPLNNLPQWSRVNTLDKARYPKPFLKDRLQPLPNTSEQNSPIGSQDDSAESTLLSDDVMNPKMKALHLEKSVNFLRQQHQDILSQLHEEIDKLKRENKELQFRLVMMNSNSVSPETSPQVRQKPHTAHARQVPTADTSDSSNDNHIPAPEQLLGENSSNQRKSQDEKIDELKIIFMEEEIRELKNALKEEKTRNQYLTQLVDQLQKNQLSHEKPRAPHPPARGVQRNCRKAASASAASIHSSNNSGENTARSSDQGDKLQRGADFLDSGLPFNATLEPLQVRIASQPPRPPTLQECQKILLHMQNVNDRQSHELNQLKSDLRDVLYSHKWTPDAYLLAKAYIAEDDAREAAVHDRLPKIALKQPSRKLPDVAYIQRDALSLPALKQTMGNKAIERRKRTQILHKSRFRREVPTQSEVSEG